MKKTLVAIAALAAVSAFAQSSVSISGGMRIGYGSDFYSNKGLMTNQSSGNTVNITVVEDLGGGLKAEGALQTRYDMASGLDTRAGYHTNRLGLSGGFGAIQMGRIGLDQHWGYTSFGSTGAGVALNPVSAYGATDNNQLRYVSPNISGFQAHLATSFKNGTNGGTFNGSTEAGKQVLLSYANGPIAVTFVNETAPTAAAALVAAVGRNPGSAAAAADVRKGSQLGASYNFGVAKVNVISGKAKNLAGATVADALTLSATAPMGPVVLKVGFKNDRTAANRDVFAIGADYALSKRTVVEANFWNQKGTAFVAPVEVKTANAMWVGVRHSF